MIGYTIALWLHSYLRWAVLALLVVVGLRAALGWARAREWARLDERLHVSLISAIDVQLVLGLWLYLWASPIARAFFADPALGMKDSVLRFFGVEHATGMLLMVLIAHVGRVRSRRAPLPRVRHRRVFVATLLSLLLVLVTIPWPPLRYGRPLLRTTGALPSAPPPGCPTVYAARCASCHGERGRGDGPASPSLRPRPRDFADPRWSASDAEVRALIHDGGAVHGLSATMPPHSDLRPADLDALVLCVHRLRDAARPERDAPRAAP